jgi:YD repeat-containing protein
MKRAKFSVVIALFIGVAYSSSFAQNYLEKLESITVIDGRKENLFDSVHVKLNDSKIRSALFYVQNQQYLITYAYNEGGMLSSVEKGNHVYYLRYDEQGRLISLKDNVIDGAKTITHDYIYSEGQIEETATGGNFPYTTTFFITGNEITKEQITRPEGFPPPMREEITYELGYEKGNLVKVLKAKENKHTGTSRTEDYTLTFSYDNKKSLFAQLNGSLFGVHAKTTALLLNSISFYNNSWEPYNIGFDMAGKNNILSMKTDIKGSQVYYPYTVSYEYNKNKTLKKLTKTIDLSDRKEYEYYVFKYKK